MSTIIDEKIENEEWMEYNEFKQRFKRGGS